MFRLSKMESQFMARLSTTHTHGTRLACVLKAYQQQTQMRSFSFLFLFFIVTAFIPSFQGENHGRKLFRIKAAIPTFDITFQRGHIIIIYISAGSIDEPICGCESHRSKKGDCFMGKFIFLAHYRLTSSNHHANLFFSFFFQPKFSWRNIFFYYFLIRLH